MSRLLRDEISNELRLERERYINNISNIIKERLPLKINSMYYYKCQGSGYYLKFVELSGENIMFNIYTKGGKQKKHKNGKPKSFYMNWYGFNLLDEITRK